MKEGSKKQGSFFGAGRAFPLALVFLSVIVGVGALGYYFGVESTKREVDRVMLLNKDPLISGDTVDFEPFWRAWNILNDRFVTSGTTTSDQEKVYGAIKGLAASLNDPYTVFFPPVEKKEFEEEVSGQFEGVGMEIGIKDGIVTVVAPLKGNPAERAGIKAGDKILAIDGTITTGMTVDDAVRRIRGEKGTVVKLTLLREGGVEPVETSVTRDTISIPSVDATLRDDGVFVVRVYNFSGVVLTQFREALREFVVSGSNKLVVDLRLNPGGYLEAAVEMASWFLPSGTEVVSEDRGAGSEREVYRSRGYDIFGDELDMVVLVDAGSASAAEIFAGALRDHGRATLIGTKTFGKGSVQELVPITKDTSLKITIARWLTPAGTSINQNGIMPDFVVPFTEEDADEGRDLQMEAAALYLTTGSVPEEYLETEEGE